MERWNKFILGDFLQDWDVGGQRFPIIYLIKWLFDCQFWGMPGYNDPVWHVSTLSRVKIWSFVLLYYWYFWCLGWRYTLYTLRKTTLCLCLGGYTLKHVYGRHTLKNELNEKSCLPDLKKKTNLNYLFKSFNHFTGWEIIVLLISGMYLVHFLLLCSISYFLFVFFETDIPVRYSLCWIPPVELNVTAAVLPSFKLLVQQ